MQNIAHATAARLVFLLSLVSMTACGLGEPSWYYHFRCNGDQDCLETNPIGQPNGDLDEGPDKINCTQLMTFADHFWGPYAKNWCDQTELPNGGATYTLAYDANGSTGGAVPVDTTRYEYIERVIVQGNPGNLALSGRRFSGWSTHADGSNKVWTQGQGFEMTEDVTVYAIFVP